VEESADTLVLYAERLLLRKVLTNLLLLSN
jgi:hypothetical protein